MHTVVASVRRIATGDTELARLRDTVEKQQHAIASLTERVAALEDARCVTGVAAPSVAPSQQRPTASRSDSHPPPTRSSAPSFGGGGEPCARCGKTVYAAERVVARGNVLHRDCFRCARCDARLVNSPSWEVHGGTFYCGPHFFQIVQVRGRPASGRTRPSLTSACCASNHPCARTERSAAAKGADAVGGPSSHREQACRRRGCAREGSLSPFRTSVTLGRHSLRGRR